MKKLNRRTLLVGAAAVTVPGSALAVTEDPILGAIAARKATIAALLRAPDDEFLDAACEAESRALQVLVTTPPTSVAGMRALLGYVIQCGDLLDLNVEPFGDDDTLAGEMLLQTLLTALERL